MNQFCVKVFYSLLLGNICRKKIKNINYFNIKDKLSLINYIK